MSQIEKNNEAGEIEEGEKTASVSGYSEEQTSNGEENALVIPSGELEKVVRQLDIFVDWSQPEKAMTDLTDKAVLCYEEVFRSNMKIIESKFRLGGIVYQVVRSSHYGDNAVTNFAMSLAKKIGKKVDPKRLYDAAKVFATFKGDIDKIKELEAKWNFPITWTYIVRGCTPALSVQNALSKEHLKLAVEDELGKIEQMATKIEKRMPVLETTAEEIRNTEEKTYMAPQMDMRPKGASKTSTHAVGVSDSEYQAQENALYGEQGVGEQANQTNGGELANDLKDQVAGLRETVKESGDFNRVVFRNHLKKFNVFLDSVGCRNINLAQQDIDMIEEVTNKLANILHTYRDRALAGEFATDVTPKDEE